MLTALPDDPPTEPTGPAGEPPPETPLQQRRRLEREDRQRGMNSLQVLLDDARRNDDGTVRLTQYRLAELTGMSRGRVQYILRGAARTAPVLEDLVALAKALDLDLTAVKGAASEVAGWRLYATRDERMETLVASASRLSDHELQAVQALVESLTRARP